MPRVVSLLSLALVWTAGCGGGALPGEVGFEFEDEDALVGDVSATALAVRNCNVIATTAKFRNDNPKLYNAFIAALQEATDFVNRDKDKAADIYIKVSNDKTPKADILEIMNNPEVKFTTEVFNLGIFTDFMAKVGSLKNPPKDWSVEMVFPSSATAFKPTFQTSVTPSTITTGPVVLIAWGRP